MSTTVLVLETDPGLRQSLVDGLEDAGYVALPASDVDEALRLSRSFCVQVAACEAGLAAGDARLRLVDLLREGEPGLKVILWGPADGPRERADEYLTAPLQAADCLAAIRRLRASRATALLSSLLSVPAKLKAQADTRRRGGARELMEHERTRVYHGLHVAIWSKLLGVDAGLDVWDNLSELEQARPSAESAADLLELAGRYHTLFDLMTAMARSNHIGAHRARAPGKVDRNRLQCLFQRVKEGFVSRDQLPLAWQLWHEQRKDDPLFARCWEAQAELPGRSAKKKKRALAPGEVALGAPVGSDYVLEAD